jgi:hypothetical protein
MTDDFQVHDLPPISASDKEPGFGSKNPGVIVLLLSPLVAFSPFIVGFPLASLLCPQPANEGNCSWAALPWLAFLTIPAGGIMFIVGIIWAIKGAVSQDK